MYLIRDVFRCKPGGARALAGKLRATVASTERADGFLDSRPIPSFAARPVAAPEVPR